MVVLSISSSMAQSAFSGIYDIKVGTRVLVAITKGGHFHPDGTFHEGDK